MPTNNSDKSRVFIIIYYYLWFNRSKFIIFKYFNTKILESKSERLIRDWLVKIPRSDGPELFSFLSRLGLNRTN